MLYYVIFSFEDQDNYSFADEFDYFVKIRVGYDISEADYQKFLKAILKRNRKYAPILLPIRTPGEIVYVDIEDISFIEVEHHTITVHCQDKKHKMTGNLSKMEDLLHDYNFVRMHQGYLVPFDKIRRIEHNDVILENETSLHIGKTYQKRIRAMARERSL